MSRVAAAMESDSHASHRVLLLTDGQANVGIRDGTSLVRFAADAQRDCIMTSEVGIADDYSAKLNSGGTV